MLSLVVCAVAMTMRGAVVASPITANNISMSAAGQPSFDLSLTTNSFAGTVVTTTSTTPSMPEMYESRNHFIQTCTKTLHKEGHYTTKTDLEIFLSMQFSDMPSMVQFDFARATCYGDYPSSSVCKRFETVVDENDSSFAIQYGNLQVVERFCADLEP